MVPSRAAASSGTGLSASQRSQPDAGKDGVMVLAATLDVSCASTMCRSSPRALPPIWRETERGAPEFKEVSPALDYILSQLEPFPPPRSGSCALNHSSPRTGRPRRRCVPGQAAEADAFLTERGRVLDSRGSGNYNHGARAGRPFPAGRRVPR
jgi:hypothetical protein